jgi:exoribonuclease II
VNRGRHDRSDLKEIARRAMLEKGLQPGFPRDALAELDSIRGPAPVVGPAIRDLRDRLWISIDNDDSRDLDQLSVSEPAPGGTTIFVAIADVDALVPKGSAIDGRARQNTTSVYTAAEIFPMLPERLSTDLTSLNEHEDRLAVVVEMLVTDDGALQRSDVYRAAVNNRAQLAYDAVSVGLEGGTMPAKAVSVPGVPEQLQVQDRAAQALRRLRHERGALELESIEPRAVFDGDDALVGLAVFPKNRARELIEDLMIAANGVTARFLQERGFASLRRVVRSPERWEKIVAVAAGYNVKLPPEPDAAALEAFLLERRRVDPVRFPDLSLVIVKLMGAGEYVVERPGESPVGHFGLAVRDYTHATAPNRRFPDLITQRLLKAALAGDRSPYPAGELGALAAHCTEQEDDANKVERQVRKSAAALLLERRIGDRFDGLVTGASDKGTWVRIFDPPAEGKLVHGFDGLEVGDKLRVKLISTDVEKGFIDFVRV